MRALLDNYYHQLKVIADLKKEETKQISLVGFEHFDSEEDKSIIAEIEHRQTIANNQADQIMKQLVKIQKANGFRNYWDFTELTATDKAKYLHASKKTLYAYCDSMDYIAGAAEPIKVKTPLKSNKND